MGSEPLGTQPEKPLSAGMGGALPSVAAAASGILVGAAIVATRFALAQTGPTSLAFLRYVVGTACLLPAVLWSERVRFARRDLLPIALLGIGQFGILISLMNFGLQSVSSGRASLIFATFPLLTMLLAAGLRHERLTSAKTFGVLMTIGGVALALGEKLAIAHPSGRSWLGECAIFASALTGAICSVLYRPYLQRYPTLPVSAFAMAASVAFLALPASAEGLFSTWPRFTPGVWLAVLFIGVSSGIGYYLWLWALRHTTATRVTVFLALSPVTATGLGAIVLAEPFSPSLLLALVCVAFGLWLSHRDDPGAHCSADPRPPGTKPNTRT